MCDTCGSIHLQAADVAYDDVADRQRDARGDEGGEAPWVLSSGPLQVGSATVPLANATALGCFSLAHEWVVAGR